MTNRMPTPPDTRKVIVGVDTHTHVHVAVAIDSWGIRLRDQAFLADSGGYQALITWAETHGRIEAFGIEGTGSDGAGLARAVRRARHRVVEVNRGDRRTRRAAGKSDTIDAEVAARSVLAGQSTAIPKTADGAVEMMRQLKITRDTAVKARTMAMNTLKQISVHAPPVLREAFHDLTDHGLLTRGAGLRPGPLDTPTASATHTLRALARRWMARTEEIAIHDQPLARLTTEGIVNLASCWQSYRMPSYRGYRFPPDIISHAVWLYHRFALSFRDVEDLLARRGVDVTYEAIRKWCRRFGLEYAGRLRRRRGRLGDTWHLDEVFVTIQGRQQYLWRAVDEAGDVLDILVQPRRNRHAAVRFFRTLLKNQRHVPRRLITDKLRSYSAACRTVMPSVLHCTDQYANNRAEVSHQPTRQRERQMRRFKSAAQLQRFASVHGIVQNLFRVGRHLLRSAHHRLLRSRAFVEWDAVTCAC